jgi:dUTP pyrophosphatase
MSDENTFGIFLNSPLAKMPSKAHPSDAGFDLVSIEEAILEPGDRKIVGTGVHVEMTSGWEAQIRPRSGNAAKYGISVLNTPGTIDATYRGEIKVILINLSKDKVSLPVGCKIAQMVFQRVPEVNLKQLTELSTNTDRGDKGFGSSGLKA